MAFLVCYSLLPLEDHTRNKAIYLDQGFYELIFSHCRLDRGPYVVLRDMALLRYKSPMMVVGDDRLELLACELAALEASGQKHGQITDLKQICAKAKADGCALTVSGDMYPEL